MPFTFSHPAIVLPLLKKYKKRFSATGLVIGSIIPDFEAFIRVSSEKIYGHTFSGMFWFDLPLGIIVAFIFHWIVREPLIDNLPLYLRRRFIVYKNFDWNVYFTKHWRIVIISTFIGIASHLIFDMATRMNLPLSEIQNEDFNGALQEACSVLGLSVIVYYVSKMYAKPRIEMKSKRIYAYWITFFLLAVLIYAIMLAGKGMFKNLHYMGLVYIDVAISAFLLALFVLSLLIAIQRKTEN